MIGDVRTEGPGSIFHHNNSIGLFFRRSRVSWLVIRQKGKGGELALIPERWLGVGPRILVDDWMG